MARVKSIKYFCFISLIQTITLSVEGRSLWTQFCKHVKALEPTESDLDQQLVDARKLSADLVSETDIKQLNLVGAPYFHSSCPASLSEMQNSHEFPKRTSCPW